MIARPGTGFLPVLAACVVWFTPAAFAAEPADTLVVPIEGVTVTGSRAPETALRTPAAVTTVSRDRIVATRQISLADGLGRVPGVFSQSRGGAQDVRITIRGYGARGNGERSNAGNMRGIRVLTDGIPLTEPDGRTSLEFVDLGSTGQVEVLRSNGSVLYGNASGGVVNLRTSLDFTAPWAEFSSRAGSFGFHKEQAVAGYTIGGARGVVSAYTSNYDGWRAHSGSATTSLQNRLSAPIDEHTRLGLLLDFASNFNLYPGALTQAQIDADPAQANPTFVTRNERRFNRVGRFGVTFDREVPDSRRLSIATWIEPKALQRSERNRYRDFTRYHAGGTATWQMQHALTEHVRGIWSAGGDEQFQDGAIQFYGLGPNGTRGTNLVSNKREGANSAGAFVQGELRWNDRWSLRAAARYDNLWYISEDRIDPALNATKHFTQVTPKGSIARYFDHHTLYASVGGGVEAPAFNEIDPPAPFDTSTSFNPFLEPMRSTSWEAGAKGSLAGDGDRAGRLGYDVALYWIEVRNDIIPFNGGAYFFTAGRSRRRGAELGLDWTPVAPVTLAGAVTVADNEYLEYLNDLGDFSGRNVAGLPPVFLDAEARWRPLPGLAVSGTVRHVGRYYADDANTARADAYSLLGAEVEYVHASPIGLVRAFVSGDNLTDENHVASVFINGVSGQFFEAGLPRNVSVGLSVTLR